MAHTWPPFWPGSAFHELTTCWESANADDVVQSDSAAGPVLRTVNFSWWPPVHVDVTAAVAVHEGPAGAVDGPVVVVPVSVVYVNRCRPPRNRTGCRTRGDLRAKLQVERGQLMSTESVSDCKHPS
jgi:hypothetical protein